ncbi:putative intracellular protease/amidase [Natronocella acetinitrilica]|uniref:Intracellular protease/amidase n=1 Tax=Natronocella acetinitrilica TaxID=414046 RepID=A0AAE3G7F5_9GAMM|nr:S8 family serine peptidase [Natronocella acetinitrilica]MCP1675763.1 putative intracellular protease/amidase [Natronocella acetinitrilica]
MAYRLIVVTSLLLLLAPMQLAADTAELLREVLPALCEARADSLDAMADRILVELSATEEDQVSGRGMEIGWQRRFAMDTGDQLRAEHIAPGGRTQRFSVEYWEQVHGELRPAMVALADGSCAVRAARRLNYDENLGFAVSLEHLTPTLEPTGEQEPLKPPVPPGTDPGGVRVAMVDSGVNYLLPDIAERLARDEHGNALGFDFWTMDARPFDAHPVPSPLFVQRHGTRTASLLLQEAPEAVLVPYRYPRTDMTRMTQLVAHAAEIGVQVMSLSLGGDELADWEAFAEAAAAHPDILFVISAGNNGRDIDQQPVYPAALKLDNALVVTSALPNGSLARGSNWGVETVDLLVPAERLRVTDFTGDAVAGSGSSYAAPRVAALAARLLKAQPDWHAPDLKASILDRVLPAFAGDADRVRYGLLPRPDIAEALPAMGASEAPQERDRRRLEGADLHVTPESDDAGYLLEPAMVYFSGTPWTEDAMKENLQEAAHILGQCGIRVSAANIHEIEAPPVFHYFHDAVGTELAEHLTFDKPTAFFVTDTLQMEPYEAEAIGRGNSGHRPALQDTVWLTHTVRDPGIALAHELVHVLMDSGEHVHLPNNLMRDETAPENTRLTDEQCDAITRTGEQHGLLQAVPH